MAEFVQQSLEEMLPELEQMERVGLFTASETRSVLKKRKAYEYKLRRRTKEKEDYLQYIQYEMNVLALIRKRREKTGYTYKKLEIDIAVVQRVHNLFKLACWRFQDDVKLWLSHVEFCKMRNEKAPVGRLFTRMLQIHNHKPDLWILAAKWEMEMNLSMENARLLLQRGLRFNPDSQSLWQEYFRMELLNADKLHKRMEILGMANIDRDEEEVPHAVLEGKVALVVYKQALEAVPGDVAFHLSFLPICRLFNFASQIESDILKDVQSVHPDSALTWDAVARQKLHTALTVWKQKDLSKKDRVSMVAGLEEECWKVYQQAVSMLNTDQMWSLYLQCCMDRLDEHVARKKLQQTRLQHCMDTFQLALQQTHLAEDMALKWLELLEVQEDWARVLSLSESLVREVYPHSVALWSHRLHLLAERAHNKDALVQELEQALQTVKDKESLPLWQFGLEWSIVHRPEYTEQLLEKAVVCCGEVSVPMKEAYLEWAAIHKDIKTVRKVYKRLSASKPLSVELFRKYIHIEKSQLESKIKRLRQAYEDAVSLYGATDTDLWLEYISLELSHPKGAPEMAGKLHFRAKNAVDENHIERFITQYTLLQTGHIQPS